MPYGRDSKKYLVFSLVKSNLIQGPDSRVDFFKVSSHSFTMLYLFMQVQITMS